MSVGEATRRYDQLLAGEHFASTVEALAQAAQNPALTYGGRPRVDVLRPHFLSSAHYRSLQHTANEVVRAMRIAIERMRGDPTMQRLLDVPPQLAAFDRHDPSPYGPLWQRIDGFICPDGELRFVEMNPTPGGVLQNNLVTHVYDRLPIMTALRRHHLVRPLPTLPHVLESLAPRRPAPREYRTANLALVLGPGAPLLVDDYLYLFVDDLALTKTFFAQNGGKVLAGELDEFSMHNGRLVLHGEPVDVLFTGAPQQLMRAGSSHPTHVAMKSGAARLITDFLWGHAVSSKATFEILTDPAYASAFGAELFAFLLDHVPWTRRVSDRRTTRGTESVDLLAYIEANQAELVLKPTRGTKGEGVVLGWRTTPEVWREVLTRAQREDYVVQARVEAAAISHPVVENGALSYASRITDFSPYIWEAAGADAAVLRMSSSGITNIGSGGTMTVPFLVD